MKSCGVPDLPSIVTDYVVIEGGKSIDIGNKVWRKGYLKLTRFPDRESKCAFGWVKIVSSVTEADKGERRGWEVGL
jgi:hypothetical protein